MEKSRTRIQASTIAIIILSVLLVASVAFGATAAYFSNNKTVTGTITLGDPININITQGGSSVQTLTFDGTALPGKVYDQKIGVQVPEGSSNALLRAKLTLTNTGEAATNVEAKTSSSWRGAEDDGYYYYNGVATANQDIDFVESITIPTSLTNEDAQKVFTITVVVEAIQEEFGAASTVWVGAPSEWLSTYANKEA